jgi:hypothetical protein
VIPLEELELKLPLNYDYIAQILRNSQYAIMSVQGDLEENGNIITSAETTTLDDELNKEKQKTIEVAADKKDDDQNL